MSRAPRAQGARRSWGTDDSATPVLHVDMDAFFASVELLEHPELRGRPLIVGGQDGRGVVSAASYEARAYGVNSAMPMARALRLCPHAVVLPVRHDVYSRVSRRVMEILGEVTPVLERVSVDEAFLDVSGARRRLGPPVAIAQRIRAEIRGRVGLPASVGIAATKSVAKIASSNAKPDGLLLVPEAATVDFLRGLPVGALWGVGGKTGAVLQREGIDTVGQLADLPLARLARLVGTASAHHLHDLAWGIDTRRVGGGGEEKSVSTERTFDDNVHDRAGIERFIVAASHDCARRLRAADMVGWGVAIKMRDGAFHTITRSAALAAPTDVGREIAQAAGALFARLPIPSGGVRLFGVRVDRLQARSSGVATPLDGDDRPAKSERAMDRIREKYGDASLRPATLLESTGQTGSSPGAETH